MSLEVISAVSAAGTFIVIGATAIAAVIQLNHLRASNQLTGLLNILGRTEDPQFTAWRDATGKIVTERMHDPAFRKSLEDDTYDRRDAPWLHLYNWYDYVGSLVKQRLIPEEAIMDVYSYVLSQDWNRGEDIVAITRRGPGPGNLGEFRILGGTRKTVDQAPRRERISARGAAIAACRSVASGRSSQRRVTPVV